MTARPHDATGDPGDPMSRPGMLDRRCTATAKSTGERCGHLAMIGATVCRHHGGAAPQVRAAAERRQAETAMMQRAERLALRNARPLDDPVGELARLGGQIVALSDAIAEMTDGRGLEELAATGDLALLERALDRTSKLLIEVNRLGLDERRVEIDERRAYMAAVVIETMLTRYGVDTGDRDIRAEIAAEIRAIEATAT